MRIVHIHPLLHAPQEERKAVLLQLHSACLHSLRRWGQSQGKTSGAAQGD